MTVNKIEYAELEQEGSNDNPIFEGKYDLVKNAQVKIEVSVGTGSIDIETFFKLREGSVVPLDQALDQAVNIMLDGKVIAKGELCAVDDNFGIQITEIIR